MQTTMFPASRRRAPSYSRSPMHSAMALAIACGLTTLAPVPSAIASDISSIDHQAGKAAITAAFHASARQMQQTAIPRIDLFSLRWQQTFATPATGARDPATWTDTEFQTNWGLEAINAQHAYARGLSGKGVRLGLLDSGVALTHSEFAGKDHRGLVMAQLLADGSRCNDATVLGGPDSCFYSVGDQPAVDGEYFDTELAFWFPDPANDPLWGNTFYSFNSHGTHVGGIMAANRDGAGMHGVAFGANLSSARLFNDSLSVIDAPCVFLGECTTIEALADASAFAYMYEQAIAQGVQAMNHSWGYTYEAYSPDEAQLYHEYLMSDADVADTMGYMADASRRSGMIQVVAAGNTFEALPTPENSPQPTLPAALPAILPDIEQYWVSVVNLNDSLSLGDQSMKCGITAQWCIAAPGTAISSTVLDGGEELAGGWEFDADGNLRYAFDDRTGVPGYADYSGSSMAAPHVTGALGLLFERFPYLTGAQVRDVMLTTATDLGSEGVDDIYGWGLLDLKKAVDGPGLLRVDTEVVMDVAAGGYKVWEGDAWDDWRNDIGGPGRLTKAGNGWLRLSGDNSFAGATVADGLLELDGDNRLSSDVRVQGGTLLINGSLTGSPLTVSNGVAVINGRVSGAATLVESNGILGGSGTLGDTRVAGTIAPGNSLGVLTVDGDYTQDAGSRFIAELLPPDQSDLLRVTGIATLHGGTLVASNLGGAYLLGQQYRVLSAEGGVVGNFSAIDGSALSPFLSLSLLGSAQAVTVDVARGAALATAATTDNQRATASALDRLAIDQGLPVVLTQLSVAEAGDAFDHLSGEIHASAQQVLLEGSRLIRDVAIGRASDSDAFGAQRDPDAGDGAWIQVQQQSGQIDGDGNAGRTQHSGNAVLVGFDHRFEAGWRLGVYGGTGETDFDVRDRRSKGDARNQHGGLYVGHSWGAVGLSLGYAHSSHRLDIDRNVAFAGFSDTLTSRYDADSDQVFVDLGYRLGGDRRELEPYLQYAHVEIESDGFREQGGVSALHGRSETTRTGLATAGLRFAANLSGSDQEQTWLSVRGNLGYRHADGDLMRSVQASWDGQEWFSVTSPTITEEALLAEIGIAARLSPNSLLEAGLSRVEGDESRDTGVNARLTINF